MVFRRKMEVTHQSLGEEIANSVTHGIGMVFSIGAFVALLVSAITIGRPLHIMACAFYGFSLLSLYTISTIYHMLRTPRAKSILQIMDHICIYLLIAGTTTPVALLCLKGMTGWTLFAFEILFCVVGITCKVIFGTSRQTLSSILYLVMGWLAIFVIKPIMAVLPLEAVRLIVLGGCSYTFGIIFFFTDKFYSYFHTVWHLFVLIGSLCHFISIYFYILPF